MSGGLDARITVLHPGGFHLDAELRLESGHTVAVLGPNGAGKSTLIAALAGLLPLHEGRVALGGRVLDDTELGVWVPPEERRLGIVHQDYLLFPTMSVLDNVAFGLRARGRARSAANRGARDLLAQLDLLQFAGRRPADLSGGQAQRVALARALATEPDMLLLDEPLAALDVTTRARLRHVLADRLAEFPGPRMLITHDPAEAFLLADQIYVLEDGAITQVGSPDDIRLRPRTSYAADLAGANLLVGVASAGEVLVGSHRLTIADTSAQGPVLATIHPRAISLHVVEPGGSPRNAWATSVTRIENYGDRVRVQTAGPLELTAEITPPALHALGIAVGDRIWLSIKATEVGVSAD
ncbi:MAG: ATP-binding cassette domain-containing protein [Acidimicrobiia bacterium]|nr:ATP-binding cassette domain-containing protein [Acidimicrobiia bacterium]